MSANNEDLQRAWDRWLVLAFYKAGRLQMWLVVRQFIETSEITEDEFKSLKRIPWSREAWLASAGRFVCGYIPKLGEYLWKHAGAPIEKIAVRVSSSKLEARQFNGDREYRALNQQTKRNMETSKAAVAARKNYNASCSRGAWNISKPPPR